MTWKPRQCNQFSLASLQHEGFLADFYTPRARVSSANTYPMPPGVQLWLEWGLAMLVCIYGYREGGLGWKAA